MSNLADYLQRLPEYPLSPLREPLLSALQQGRLLLEAEPGAGKSTLAPLWILAASPAVQQVWLIQPRVLAAQALAQRLAELLSEQPGQTVGYQVPYDKCAGENTRLLLMTPGILLQHLLQNPTLDKVACVILDEIHERSVNQDTAWAWLQEVQILRDDLQLVLMSATPDPALQQQITNRLFAPGRCFPVSTTFLPAKNQSAYGEKLEEHLLRALQAHPGWQGTTTLVFLPGWSEIEKAAQAIQQRYPGHPVYRLHSRVPAVEQKRALDPRQGARIILATNIAETSLTIADVTLVIDSGLVRRPDYEQRTGITRLRNARISQASADQRRGRAGRVQAGHCIRLWSQDQPLAAADLPEIRATDYLPLALRLAHWGSPAQDLPWLEAPNLLALQFAQQQLQQMQLLDDRQKITARGERVSALGTHPRIAALLLSQQQSIAESTLLLALGLHFELSQEGCLDAFLETAAQELKRNRQWQQQQRRWLASLSLQLDTAATLDTQALARAFSDRIGRLQESGRYRLNSGISVAQQESDSASPWAVFPVINAKPKGHTGIGVGLQLSREQQRALSVQHTQLIYKNSGWQKQTLWRMGGVDIDEQNIPLTADTVAPELLAHLRGIIAEKGFHSLPWSDSAQRLLQRARLLASQKLLDLPDISEVGLVNSLERWLQPFLTDKTQLDSLPWESALEFYLGYDHCQQLKTLLPEKIALPSGRDIIVEFSAEGVPQVSAKLQEFFGCEDLQLANGNIPLKILLLSPNGSPLAITQNLKTFWQQGYPDVRKDMRGRYPRHPWPENPLEHIATALTKRKLMQQN
ncbi:MAG TPA: ATP-dependent helicase HrpB [Cellvibrio sp.]|nr:ATP-dependent helicase HrpB [Cellvibrio sp.]